MVFKRPPIAPHPPGGTRRRWMPPPEMNPDLIRRRALPVVGRLAEQKQLWQCLWTVQQTQQLQVALIEGPSGAGGTHLAKWLNECAHREGAATTLESPRYPPAQNVGGFLHALSLHLRFQTPAQKTNSAKIVRQLWHEVRHSRVKPADYSNS